MFSGDCKQYTVKLTASGVCFSACFGGVLGTCFPASGSKWGGNCAAPTCSNVCGDNPATGPTVGTTTRMPSVASDGDFYKVTYPSNCGPATSLDWQIGGRYGPGDPGTTFIKIAGTTCTGGSGNGCFDPNANASWIRKVNPANSQPLGERLRIPRRHADQRLVQPVQQGLAADRVRQAAGLRVLDRLAVHRGG